MILQSPAAVLVVRCLAFGAGLACLQASDAGEVRAERPVCVSFGDHFIVGNGDAKMDTPERIEASMRRWRDDGGVTAIYMRTSAWFIRNLCRRNLSEKTAPYMVRYWKTSDDIFQRFDPYQTALEAAHRLGLKIYAYVTVLDEGSPPEVLYGGTTPFPWQSWFTIRHPEYLVVDRQGKCRQYGVMEYAYPEVRRYKLKEITDFLDAYDYDGVYICTRSHSQPAESADQFGFNEPVVKTFQERYGLNLLKEEFSLPDWRALRGEFFTQFLREVRAELNRRGKKLALAVPRGDIFGPPYGNMKLDWRTWVKEKLVDRLHVGVISGAWLYPAMKGKDRERGYLASQEERFGLPPVREAMEKTYRPLCEKYGVAVQYGVLSSLSLSSGKPYGVVRNMDRLDFASGRFTVEVWVKSANSRQDYGRVLSQYDHTLPDDAGRGWEIYVDPQSHLVFRVNNGQRDFVLKTVRSLPAKKWVHLAFVCEGAGGKMRVYIDGSADTATTAAPAMVRKVPVPLHLGRYPSGGRPFDGWLSEIRVSSKARKPVAPPTAPLFPDSSTLLLWHPKMNQKDTSSEGTLARAVLHLVNVEQWESGPNEDLAAFRVGSGD